MFQSKNYRIGCVRSFGFHNQRDDDRDVQPLENWYHQAIGQADQKKDMKIEREKEAATY